MGAPTTRLGPITRGLAVTMLVATTAACSASRQPDEAEPTDVPWSGELRYGWVGEEFCDQIRLDRIASDFGMKFDGIRSGPSGGRLLCAPREINADYLDDEITVQNLAELHIGAHEEPEDAYTVHNTTVNASIDRLPATVIVKEIDGWWEDGVSLEHVEPGRRGHDGWVRYHIYHENLSVAFILIVYGLDTQGDMENLHDVAGAVLDEVKTQLPCEPLADQPPPGCG